MRRPATSLATAIFSLVVPLSQSTAEPGEKAGISVELNDVRQTDGGCRFAFLFKNELSQTITDLAVELVLFDKQQRLIRLVVIAAGQMPAGKSRLKQFDIAETACDGIGRILMNDVKRCTGEGLGNSFCLQRMRVTSRVQVPFGS